MINVIKNKKVLNQLFKKFDFKKHEENNIKTFKSFILFNKDSLLKSLKKLDFKVLHYSNNSSYCLYNNKELLLITFCEGDIFIDIANNIPDFNNLKETTLTWYKENL